jgi:hypothetical protein
MKNKGRINAETTDLARLLWVSGLAVRPLIEELEFCGFPKPHGA